MNSIRYLGGIQRVTVIKANAIANIVGNEVYVVVSDNKNGVCIDELSPKVHLIDLDINYYSDDWKSNINVLKGIFIKRREHKKKMKKLFDEIKPDIVISVGQSEKNFLPNIKGNWKTIREFHFVKDYRQRNSTNLFQKILAISGDMWDRYTLRKYDCIVVLTQEDKEENWRDYNKVIVVPNPASFHSKEIAKLDNNIIISTGRLSYQKNFSSLIQAFKLVVKNHPDWILNIFGTGEEELQLKQLIKDLGLNRNIYLKGYSADVKQDLLGACIYVSSSRFEGFPMSLIEAMECGLPIISYACPCGPKDLINNGSDGFLIPLGNEKEMAEKICQLIDDTHLRKLMGIRAKQKAELYNIDSIVKQWMNLFNNLLNESNNN